MKNIGVNTKVPSNKNPTAALPYIFANTEIRDETINTTIKAEIAAKTKSNKYLMVFFIKALKTDLIKYV